MYVDTAGGFCAERLEEILHTKYQQGVSKNYVEDIILIVKNQLHLIGHHIDLPHYNY